MTEETSNLPTKDEIDNIGNEAQKDAGFQKMLKFKKGDYFCDGEEVPLGTKYIAHCIGWTKTWVHFVDQKVVERKLYRIAEGQRAPERDPEGGNVSRGPGELRKRCRGEDGGGSQEDAPDVPRGAEPSDDLEGGEAGEDDDVQVRLNGDRH